MPEQLKPPPAKEPEKKTVFYGIGKAVKKVPEWHEERFMEIYDKYFARQPETVAELEAAYKTRLTVRKVAHGLSYFVSGVEVALIASAAGYGFVWLKNGKRPEIGKAVASFFKKVPAENGAAGVGAALPIVLGGNPEGTVQPDPANAESVTGSPPVRVLHKSRIRVRPAPVHIPTQRKAGLAAHTLHGEPFPIPPPSPMDTQRVMKKPIRMYRSTKDPAPATRSALTVPTTEPQKSRNKRDPVREELERVQKKLLEQGIQLPIGVNTPSVSTVSDAGVDAITRVPRQGADRTRFGTNKTGQGLLLQDLDTGSDAPEKPMDGHAWAWKNNETPPNSNYWDSSPRPNKKRTGPKYGDSQSPLPDDGRVTKHDYDHMFRDGFAPGNKDQRLSSSNPPPTAESVPPASTEKKPGKGRGGGEPSKNVLRAAGVDVRNMTIKDQNDLLLKIKAEQEEAERQGKKSQKGKPGKKGNGNPPRGVDPYKAEVTKKYEKRGMKSDPDDLEIDTNTGGNGLPVFPPVESSVTQEPEAGEPPLIDLKQFYPDANTGQEPQALSVPPDKLTRFNTVWNNMASKMKIPSGAPAEPPEEIPGLASVPGDKNAGGGSDAELSASGQSSSGQGVSPSSASSGPAGRYPQEMTPEIFEQTFGKGLRRAKNAIARTEYGVPFGDAWKQAVERTVRAHMLDEGSKSITDQPEQTFRMYMDEALGTGMPEGEKEQVVAELTKLFMGKVYDALST